MGNARPTRCVYICYYNLYVKCLKYSCCPDAGGPALETVSSPEVAKLYASLKQAVRDSVDELDSVSSSKDWLKTKAVAAAENTLFLKLESLLCEACKEVEKCVKLSEATLLEYYTSKEDPRTKKLNALIKKYSGRTAESIQEQLLLQLKKEHQRLQHACRIIDCILKHIRAVIGYTEQGMLRTPRTDTWSDGTTTEERRRVQTTAELAKTALFFFHKETEMFRIFDSKSIEGQNEESHLNGGKSVNEYAAHLCGNALDAKSAWEFKIHHFMGAFKYFKNAATKKAAAEVTISCSEANLQLLKREFFLLCTLLCQNRK